MHKDDISSYVKNYIKESNIEEKRKQKLYYKLNKRIRKIAKKLGPKYNLRTIYLFGSLLERDSFHLNSDIDIGVKEIESKKYLDLWGDFEKGLDHKFDLVNMDRCNKRLKNHIEEEGEIIYDRKKKKS